MSSVSPPVDPTPYPLTRSALEAGIADGLHLGGQLSVFRHGRPVIDHAFGEVRPGEPMRTEHLMLWLSAGKPITAVMMARFWERGALRLDDAVARYIPEFASHGKERITIRHLLTHTAGIRMLGVGWPEESWEEIVRKIALHRPEPRWIPGQKAGYHLTSSWFILGDLIQRLADLPYTNVLREQLFEPLQMSDCWIGMPRQRFLDYGSLIAPTFDMEKPTRPSFGWESELHCTRPSPGGSARGPMRQLARFYAMLIEHGSFAGTRILSPQTVEALTARHRVGMVDRTFKAKIDWGLGFIINSAYYEQERLPYAYGGFASRRTFGHSGYRSTVAFGDPEHGLAVALAFNGTPSEAEHEARVASVLDALYRDLQLADG